MFAYELPLNSPEDDCELIESLVSEACRDFLGLNFKSHRFDDLFDVMFEEVRENLNKYLN
jgi:hypothetical protein